MNEKSKEYLEEWKIWADKITKISSFNTNLLGVLISKKFSFQEIANLHTACIEQLNKEYPEQNIKELTDLIDLIFDMIIQNKENTERKEK